MRTPNPTCARCGGPRTMYGGEICCAPCYRKDQREYYRRTGGNTPERLERNRHNARKLRSSGLTSNRVYDLKKKYGLSESEYLSWRAARKNQCEICGKTFDNIKPHIDHCHTTNTIRGMLCFSCNSGMGHFKDDPVILRLAAKYLIRYQKSARIKS